MTRRRALASFFAICFGSLLLTGVVHDRYRAGARALYVVNRTGSALQIELAGEKHEVPAGEEALALSVAEGSHSVAIVDSSGVSRSVEVAIEGNVLDRLLGGRVFVLNVGAAAPLEWETAHYGPDAPEGTTQLRFGEVLRFERVDHAFEDFPPEAPAGFHVRVGIAPGAPAELLGALPPERRDAGTMAYAAFHLGRSPEDDALLALFLGTARRLGAEDQALATLRPRLTERPVRVAWHRAYQDLRRGRGEIEALRGEYFALSDAAPGDASLRVLGARVAATPDDALRRYRAALRLDAQQPWGHYGVGVHLFRRGEFTAAREHADLACKLRPDLPGFLNLRYQVRCAQRDWSALASELRAARQQRRLAFDLFLRTLEALVAAGDAPAARNEAQVYRQTVGKRDPDDERQLVLLADIAFQGLRGRWEQARAKAKGIRSETQRARLAFELALGAADLEAASQGQRSAKEALLLALAWRVRGDMDQAKTWRARALEGLASGSPAERALAKELGGSPNLVALRSLALAPGDKAAALLLLALQGHQRSEALKWAKRYTFRRLHPWPVLERALKALSE